MFTENIDLNAAVDALHHSGVIAYPTEAVWGLGCDPFNQEAVDKLLKLKSRPVDKGLILVAGDIKQIQFLLKKLPADKLQKLTDSWPGPVTWLIEDTDDLLPAWIKGNFTSVAVRVSDHPTVKALCDAFGGCIVSTSLNPAGLDPALNISQSKGYFADAVDCYVSGDLGSSKKPSNIIELATGNVIR